MLVLTGEKVEVIPPCLIAVDAHGGDIEAGQLWNLLRQKVLLHFLGHFQSLADM